MARVTLRPRILLGPGSDEMRALELAAEALRNCFIGDSVSTPIEVAPQLSFIGGAVAAR